MRNAAAIVLVLLGVAAGAEEKYTFVLDGEPIDPSIVSIGGGSEPRPGDLAEIEHVWVTLGEPGAYRFRAEGNRIFRVAADGTETLFAATVHGGTPDTLRLAREDMKDVRGLRIGHWNETIANLVSGIDPATTCVTLEITVRDDDPVPRLPATLQCLRVESSWDVAFPLDASLGRLRSLRVLIADGARVEDPYGFKDLAELRFLSLWGAQDFRDVGFVARMPRLRMLAIAGTDVADLGPLGGHPSLVTVYASGKSVERLPAAPMPALRELVAYGAQWSDGARAAFLRANPGCTLTDRWELPLREALATCDRIRVRSGGTCHREERAEETLFEVRDAEEIRETIAGIAICNVPSSWGCMCCGWPTLEFYAGAKLLAMVGFHHGSTLRWPGGPWPGDAFLTNEGAERLKQWFAGHGVVDVDGPLPIREWARRQQIRGYRGVLGESFEAVWDAGTPEARAIALRALAGTEEERVAIWLRVLGCHEGGWDRAVGLDAVAMGLLAEVPAATLAGALPKVLGEDDHEGRDGATRWLLGEDRWKVVPARTLAAVLPAIGDRALEHPVAYSRRRAVLALGEIGSPEAVALLRALVRGEIEPRGRSKVDAYELPGTPLARDDPPELLRAKSERAVAAFLLLRLGDVAYLAAIRELAASAEGADAKLLRAGLKLLEQR